MLKMHHIIMTNHSEKRLTMENTLEKNKVNIAYEELTSMDFGNSFDYTTDYYINSFDYVLDEDDTIQESSSKGCQVVSSGDSITIVHENGKDKHISNPPYECASDKYEAKKKAKESAKKVARQTSTTSSTYKTTTVAQNSHDEVFGNNTQKKDNSGAIVKLFILLFIFFPIISSILSSCGAFISALFK